MRRNEHAVAFRFAFWGIPSSLFFALLHTVRTTCLRAPLRTILPVLPTTQSLVHFIGKIKVTQSMRDCEDPEAGLSAFLLFSNST
ncbi:hypothetical protein EDB84DRAFT_1513922 [Lactarius hengduanensis]|nr:hypothetical protein EDB84DRAFT_1513922 [Lactarius hengduanensis]